MNKKLIKASAMSPERLSRVNKKEREIARYVRDCQWRLMEKIQAHGVLWFCVWNKSRRPELPDEKRCGLLTGMDYLDWIGKHPEWFIQGEWDEAREAFPLQLRSAGLFALNNRDLYDMEPLDVGLVEPGYVVTPLPAEQRTRTVDW